MPALVVYVTTSSRDEALSIGRAVVGERLAACANVVGEIRSIFWWQGQLNEDGEALLILKTSHARVADLIERVRALHSYTTPCITAWPITAGNRDYLAWIDAETAG
ncbi:MAG TPA: divalent-cation tolerance protein CutA [Rhodospirillales bacterium]|nr:divalent-cation tolerance protein CutA [Rhodospirillales bacterium]